MISKKAAPAKKSPFPKLADKKNLAKKPAKKQRPIKESNTVYLSNLSYDRDRIGVKKLVNKFGEVKNINIVIDLDTKMSKGMAFVEFATIEAAKLVIDELNGELVDGRTLKANFAIPQKPLVLKLKSELEEEAAKKPMKRTNAGFANRKKPTKRS